MTGKRRGGWTFWFDNLHRHWSFGFELYRTPMQFSRGKGPEYGAYLYLGPLRWHVSWTKPYTGEDIEAMQAAYRRIKAAEAEQAAKGE